MNQTTQMFYIASFVLERKPVRALAWTITCPKCSHKHHLARDIVIPQRIKLVCHNCECIFRCDITHQDIQNYLKLKQESKRRG